MKNVLQVYCRTIRVGQIREKIEHQSSKWPKAKNIRGVVIMTIGDHNFFSGFDPLYSIGLLSNDVSLKLLWECDTIGLDLNQLFTAFEIRKERCWPALAESYYGRNPCKKQRVKCSNQLPKL